MFAIVLLRLDIVAELPAKYSLNENETELTITDVQKSYKDVTSGKIMTDLVVIQCNVSNPHGYAYTQAYINVLGIRNMQYL